MTHWRPTTYVDWNGRPQTATPRPVTVLGASSISISLPRYVDEGREICTISSAIMQAGLDQF